MVKATKKKNSGNEPPNPEAEERTRLKNLGFSRNLLSQTPAKSDTTLNPSKTVIKHHGKDIIKKSQRKNRFLFSFPGLISPLTGGKIGELKDLGTKNPILYLDFPRGQVKLFGTIVYPKNRYLTLQFSKGGKNVMCEDYFDNMIVFSEAWWIGTKDENPEEVRLEFPKELKEEKHVDHDFKGGAGTGPEEKLGGIKPREEKRKPESPMNTDDIDISDDSCPSPGITLKDGMEVTPVRHSARTSGRRFNFAEILGDDSDGSGPSDVDMSEIKGKKVIEEVEDFKTLKSIPNLKKKVNSRLVLPGSSNDIPVNDKQPCPSVCKSEKESESKQGPLVQATIASLFQKVDTKKLTGSGEKSSISKVAVKKLEKINLKRKADQVEDGGPKKKGTVTKERKAERGSSTKQKQHQVEYETIEDSSSESEDIEESDE